MILMVAAGSSAQSAIAAFGVKVSQKAAMQGTGGDAPSPVTWTLAQALPLPLLQATP